MPLLSFPSFPYWSYPRQIATPEHKGSCGVGEVWVFAYRHHWQEVLLSWMLPPHYLLLRHILLHMQMRVKSSLSTFHSHTKYGREALTQAYLLGPKLTIRYFMWRKWTVISCSWEHEPTHFQDEAVNTKKSNLQRTPGKHKVCSERLSTGDWS
jgi:hypothetical protein